MEVTQVKRLNDATSVLWTTRNGQHEEKHSLDDCPDVPEKDFLDQMATVEADIVAKTGFGAKFGAGFTLTGISMSRNAAGRRQYVPHVKVNFGWGETGAAMSLLLAPDDEQKRTTGKNVLTPAELANIEQLFELGGKYATGSRHQQKLELEEKEAA